MKRALLLGAIAFAVVAGGSSGATAAGTPTAQVESIATVTSENTVIFEFDLYDCPAGQLVLVEWTARQPDKPDSDAAGGGGYGFSNGDRVLHLVVNAGQSAFLPGLRWVGSGVVMCGAVAIPVEGSGQTKSGNGGV